MAAHDCELYAWLSHACSEAYAPPAAKTPPARAAAAIAAMIVLL